MKVSSASTIEPGPPHRSQSTRPHSLTDAMAEEPRTFVCDLQDAVHLMRAAALLRARQQIDGLQHLMQRDMGALENGANLDRELFTALVAFVDTHTGCATF